MRAVFEDPAGKAILQKRLGDMLERPEVSVVLDMTLAEVAEKFSAFFSAGLFKAIQENLAKIK